VSTYIPRRPEFRQLLIGISTRRYFPPSGTAGFARSLVSGKRREPAPPPMMIDNVRLATGIRGVGVIGDRSLGRWTTVPILPKPARVVTAVPQNPKHTGMPNAQRWCEERWFPLS